MNYYLLLTCIYFVIGLIMSIQSYREIFFTNVGKKKLSDVYYKYNYFSKNTICSIIYLSFIIILLFWPFFLSKNQIEFDDEIDE